MIANLINYGKWKDFYFISQMFISLVKYIHETEEEGDKEKFDCTQKRRGLCSGNRGKQSQREMTAADFEDGGKSMSQGK